MQVNFARETSEREHPEGEAAGRGDAILQHRHCAVSRVRTPKEKFSADISHYHFLKSWVNSLVQLIT